MKSAAIALIFAFAGCVECSAGTTGVMHGYVRDTGGHPVAGALVTVKSPSQNAETHTDKRGFFVFLTLPPDVYTVTAQKFGTSGAYAPGARIYSDQTTFLDLRINPHRLCGPMLNRVPLAAYQGSDQFWSLDTRLMEHYPPNTAPPILLPLVTPVQAFICL